jgi:hypothetical protein
MHIHLGASSACSVDDPYAYFYPPCVDDLIPTFIIEHGDGDRMLGGLGTRLSHEIGSSYSHADTKFGVSVWVAPRPHPSVGGQCGAGAEPPLMRPGPSSALLGRGPLIRVFLNALVRVDPSGDGR